MSSLQGVRESEESDRSLVSSEGRSRWELNLTCLRHLPGSCARCAYFPYTVCGPAARISAHEDYSAFEPGQLIAECVVQPSTCTWRRIFVRDIPSGLLRGKRFHSEDGYLIGSR